MKVFHKNHDKTLIKDVWMVKNWVIFSQVTNIVVIFSNFQKKISKGLYIWNIVTWCTAMIKQGRIEYEEWYKLNKVKCKRLVNW